MFSMVIWQKIDRRVYVVMYVLEVRIDVLSLDTQRHQSWFFGAGPWVGLGFCGLVITLMVLLVS